MSIDMYLDAKHETGCDSKGRQTWQAIQVAKWHNEFELFEIFNETKDCVEGYSNYFSFYDMLGLIHVAENSMCIDDDPYLLNFISQIKEIMAEFPADDGWYFEYCYC